MNMVNIGDKFGDLEIIDNKRTRVKSSYYYGVKCSCGKEYLIQCSDITGGKTTSCKTCGNLKKRSVINLYDKYGDWTVISEPIYHNAQIRYRVKCICGNERFMTASQLKDPKKYLKCLKCFNGKFLSNFRLGYISRLKRNAEKRKINFSEDLTPELLYDILKKQNFKCALSGDPLLLEDNSLDHKFTEMPLSLDRIDSSIGYEVGNVQWVTKIVNFAKQKLSDKDFIELCNRIVNNNNKKNE